MLGGKASVLLEDVRGYGPVMQVVDDFQAFEAGEEGIVVLACWLHPLHFGKGGHARQHLVFSLLLDSNVFGPQIGLDPQDVRLGFGRQVGVGFVTIYLFQWQATSDGQRLLFFVFAILRGIYPTIL